MENKYTKRMLDSFPKNIGFTENKNDPLHIIVNSGAVMVNELERIKGRDIEGLYVNKANAAEPSGIYYIPLGDVDMNEIQVDPDLGSDVQMVESRVEFLDNNVTGFDAEEEVSPTGIFPSGILGVSYGFDWDEPTYYIAPSGSDYIYEYDDINAGPSLVNYAIKVQRYDNVGVDEYINFVSERAGAGTLPAGVSPDDIVKVVYLKNTPEDDTLVVIDVGNLQDSNDPNSDGIVVNDTDYAITGNRVVFAPTRSDYNPAIVIPTGIEDFKKYIYPDDYQPDKAYDSVFIVEYEYRVRANPRYLTQVDVNHNLGLKARPQASS